MGQTCLAEDCALFTDSLSPLSLQLLRIQLFHMKNMFKTCRLAKE